jgi:hypothetical protein
MGDSINRKAILRGSFFFLPLWIDVATAAPFSELGKNAVQPEWYGLQKINEKLPRVRVEWTASYKFIFLQT